MTRCKYVRASGEANDSAEGEDLDVDVVLHYESLTMLRMGYCDDEYAVLIRVLVKTSNQGR